MFFFSLNLVCALIWNSGLGVLISKFLSVFDRAICQSHDSGRVLPFQVSYYASVFSLMVKLM